MDGHFLLAALLERLLKFFLYIIQRGLWVGGSFVLAVCFPDVPDDAVQIIVHDMAVKVAFLHLPQFQRPHIKVIFSGRILAHDGLPGGLQHQIHLLHPHIGDLVDTDFHIHHQPPEIRVGSQFAEKSVVDFAAPQKVDHFIGQMERLHIGVGNFFIFRQPHQIVSGHAVKVRQRCYRKRADVLILMKQKEQLAAQEQKLEELTLKIEDVETLLDDVSDAAYDKAVEVVTDTVRQETHKEDIRLVEESKKWVLSPERKAPKKEREYAAERLDGVITKIKNAMQHALAKIQRTLMQPEVKQAGKEQVKKKAKESIMDMLAKAKINADRDNRERWEREGRIAPTKKQDMEL